MMRQTRSRQSTTQSLRIVLVVDAVESHGVTFARAHSVCALVTKLYRRRPCKDIFLVGLFRSQSAMPPSAGLSSTGVGLDAESMDEQRRTTRVMVGNNERITLDEALGKVREQFGAVPGGLVASSEHPEALPAESS